MRSKTDGVRSLVSFLKNLFSLDQKGKARTQYPTFKNCGFNSAPNDRIAIPMKMYVISASSNKVRTQMLVEHEIPLVFCSLINCSAEYLVMGRSNSID